MRGRGDGDDQHVSYGRGQEARRGWNDRSAERPSARRAVAAQSRERSERRRLITGLSLV